MGEPTVRTSSVLLCLMVLTLPASAATPVTVAQLEQFLTHSHTEKLSDAEIARRLGKVELSEQLTSKSLARIFAEATPGPKTEEQLEFLAAVSLLQPPPPAELPGEPPPDQPTQKKIVRSAREYAGDAPRVVPDFLAVRETRAFNNLPIQATKKHQRPTVEMHFASEARREIAVRNGKEVYWATSANEGAGNSGLASGLSSWGEFGAILKVVLADTSDETLRWSRWQRSESASTVAVFRYRIPRASSHYTVDFCCYRRAEDDPTEHSFKDKPPYRGEMYINPMNGEIDRITLDADLAESAPVTKSSMAVQYGRILIAGKPYLCPVWSVALTELHNTAIEKIDGIGIERHLNKTEFTRYHKFGSTARILTGSPQQP